MALEGKNLYKILGVEPTATQEQIDAAFKKLAVKLHPDVNKAPDAEERFKEVSAAYSILSDKEKRARYDFQLRYGAPGSAGSPRSSYPGSSAGSQDPFGAYRGSTSGWQTDFDVNGQSLEDFLRAMGFDMSASSSSWSQGSGFAAYTDYQAAAYKPEAGADIHLSHEMMGKEGRLGTSVKLQYQRYESCSSCHGSGTSASEKSHSTCPRCHGTGYVKGYASVFDAMMGAAPTQQTCPTCHGSGQLIDAACESCHGEGRVQRLVRCKVDIPAHSHDGDTITVKGRGHAGRQGGENGDLLVHLVFIDEHVSSYQALNLRAFAASLICSLAALRYSFFFVVIALVVLMRSALALNQSLQRSANPRYLFKLARYLGEGILIGAFLSAPFLLNF